MPRGKVAIKRERYIGVRHVDERESCTHELVLAIDAGKQKLVWYIDVQIFPPHGAGNVYIMHAHAGDIPQYRIEPSGFGGLRRAESSELPLQSSHLLAIRVGQSSPRWRRKIRTADYRAHVSMFMGIVCLRKC